MEIGITMSRDRRIQSIVHDFDHVHQPCVCSPGNTQETISNRPRSPRLDGGARDASARDAQHDPVHWTDGNALGNVLLGPVLALGMDPMSSAIAAGVHPVDLARREMSFYADLFQKMTDSCFRKCVTRYHDAELQTGEGVCVDRCVFKYMGAVQRIGELLQEGQAAPSMGGPAASIPR